MRILLTLKLTPESRNDLIHTFGGQYRDCREYVERMVASGSFGPPDKVGVRWLLDSGRWDAADPAQVQG